MNPDVSIIIATFNAGKTLKVALTSVLNQTFQSWECVIVDGGSKDNTVEIIREYELKDNRFRHISEPDNGIYDAFNKGWRMAKGEWVYYLGSDDRLTKESFTALLKEKHPDCDVISGDVWIEKLDGTIKPNVSKGFNGCHQGKLVRRSIIEKMNGFDEQYRILADKDLMIKMEKYGVKIVNIHSMVAYFFMDGASQKLSNEWKRYKERVKIYRANKVSRCAYITCALIHFRIICSYIYRKLRNRISK